MRTSIVLFLAVFTTFLMGCESENDSETKVAIGGKMYGGEMRFMFAEKVTSLFPMSSVDIHSQRIISQIFDPLFRLDNEKLEVQPGIAESFKVSKDASIYTLKIRKNVRFHEDECINDDRTVTAEDVKFSLDFACSGLPNNEISYLLINRIKGAKEFNNASKKELTAGGVSGIKVLDPSTIEITLVEPFSGFEKILTHSSLSIFPREAYEEYGDDLKNHPVGTGAYALEKFTKDIIVLKKNPNYWRLDAFGNQLPFIDKITMTYSKDKKSELKAFQNREVDMVFEIPVDEIQFILGSLKDAIDGKNVKHRIENETGLKMDYVAFACKSNEFSDVRVRQAFNMAIDRQSLVDNWLEGEGYPALNGFVPPMDFYPNEKVVPQKFDVQFAKNLLKEAGYPNGEGFPAIDFYLNAEKGSTSYKMAKSVVDQVKANLNITLTIKHCTLQERDLAIQNGTAKMWRTGWIADYPDPETFLGLFYSKNLSGDNASTVINTFNFKNDEFDRLFEASLREINTQKRNQLMVDCDQIIVDYSPVLPILTEDFIVMVNARIRGFKTNAMEQLDFGSIFIKEPRN
jgi:oligopeptide transport system substrate-binding protein